MREEITPKEVATLRSYCDDLQLSNRERRLLKNFRQMKESAREMLVDLSDQYKRTLPEKRAELRLLRPGE